MNWRTPIVAYMDRRMLRDREQNIKRAFRVGIGFLCLNVASFGYPLSRGVPLTSIVGKTIGVDSLLTMALDLDSDDFAAESTPQIAIEEWIERAHFQPLDQLLNTPIEVAALVDQAETLKSDPILFAEKMDSPLSALLAEKVPVNKRRRPTQMQADWDRPAVVLPGTRVMPQTPSIASSDLSPEEPSTPLSEIQETSKPIVNVVLKNKEVIIFPTELNIPRTGEVVEVNISEEEGAKEELSVFVRNNELLEWRSNERQIIGRKEGATELYLHYKNALYILPVKVGSDDDNVALPRELTVLDSVSTSIKNASYTQNLDSSGTLGKFASLDKKIADKKDAAEEEEPQQSENGPQSFEFVTKPSPYVKRMIDIQIVDERSNEDSGQLFPANGVELRILGSDLAYEADAQGMVHGVELIQGSSFLVEIKDPLERFRPSLFELSSHVADKVKLTLLRNFSFDHYLQLSGNPEMESSSSLCANIVNEDGQPAQNVKVTSDAKGVQAYYFNQYGYLDRLQDRTSQSGRFCMFNLEPGPQAFYFVNKEGEEEGPVPLNFFEGFHIEHRFVLGEKRLLQSSLAAVPTAYEQWHGGALGESHYRPISYVDLFALGEEDFSWEEDEDQKTLYSTQASYGGRSFFLSRASEFEDTLYRIDEGGEDSLVTPLFPRGFLDDMAFFSGYAMNPSGGSVLVEHGALEGEEDYDGVYVSLLNHRGQMVGEKIAWHGEDHVSTLFLNVPAGTYIIKVQTPDGKNLCFDTVLVYDETLSYRRTGSPVVRA